MREAMCRVDCVALHAYTDGMKGYSDNDLRVLVPMEREFRIECHDKGTPSDSLNTLRAALEHLLGRPADGDEGYDVYGAYRLLGLWSEREKHIRYALCSDIQEMPRAATSEDPEVSLLARWRLSVGK